MFWRLGAGYVWGFSSWAIVLRQSHILCNQFHPRHNHVLCQYTGSKTSMTRKWCFVVFGRQQTWNIPNHEPYLCADCGFQRQEHGDSWMVPTTQMFWLQRRWFCQTVERITPEGSKSFCIVITCFPTTALVEFSNSIFWQFCSLTIFSQRGVTCIATILQVSFHYSIFRPFDHKSNCFWEWSLLSLFSNIWSESWM